MLLGDFQHTLDEKGRVVMPSAFRSELEGGCVVTKGPEGQLLVFPSEEFRRFAAELRSKATGRKQAKMSRLIFSGADQQNLDRQGRALLKQEHRDYAGLTGVSEVAVIGNMERAEVWNLEQWHQERQALDRAYQDEEEEVVGM